MFVCGACVYVWKVCASAHVDMLHVIKYAHLHTCIRAFLYTHVYFGIYIHLYVCK